MKEALLYTADQMSNRTLGIMIFLAALAIWIGVYWFFISHSDQNRPTGWETPTYRIARTTTGLQSR
jgi:hypothetical protein